MFKKFVLRSLAGATAVGSALTLSLVSTPSVVTSAPEIRNVACSVKYPGSVSTTTQLSLSRSIAVYGSTNTAKATVSRDDSDKNAGGSVRFTLSGGGVNKAWTVSLSGGAASVTLPKSLEAGNTYTVNAQYSPPSCSVLKPSSDSAYYTVVKAKTLRSVNAPDVDRGERASVSVVVSSQRPGMFTPRGQVRIVVKRGGNVLATKTVALQDGRVRTSFGKFRPGSYDVVARYFGTSNFNGARGTDDFRVRR